MKWLILTAAIANLFLAILVWVRNPKRNINVYFGIYGVITALWVFNNFIFRFFPDNLLIIRNSYAIGALSATSSLLWIISFCEGKIKKGRILLLSLIGVFLFVLSHSSGAVIKAVEELTIAGFRGLTGPYFWLYSLYIFGVLAYICYKVYSTKLKSIGTKALQLKYIFIGIVTWLSIVIFVSFILPLLGNLDFTSLDSPSSFIFIAFTSYAMVKFRFLDIRLIVLRTITFAFIVFLITSLFAIASSILGTYFAPLVGFKSNLVVGLIIGLIVSIAYNPTRKMLERVTSKFLFKQSYDPEKLLSKISDAASSILELNKLLPTISGLLDEAFSTEKIAVSLLNKKGKLQIYFEKSFDPDEADGLTRGNEAVMWKHFKREPSIAVIDEMVSRYEAGEYQPISKLVMYALHEHNIALVIPLYTQSNLIGMLAVGNKKSGDLYNQQDLNVLEIISGQVAVAIDNARLYDELKEFNITLQQKVDVATKDLRSANIQLKKLDKSKSEFISIASHQLRTPLTIIKGYVSMMLDGSFGNIPKKVVPNLDKVFVANERLIRLVENLLDISRIESGRQEFTWEELDFVGLATEVIEELQFPAGRKKLNLVFVKPKQKLPKVYADKAKLHEMMFNFIDNSIKYTEKGKIEVSVQQDPKGYAMFSVKDKGRGVLQDTIPDLFKKFSRGEGSFTVHTEGTGLGLYVVRVIAEAHHGTVGVESEGRDKGSHFFFQIPFAGPKTKDFKLQEPVRKFLGKKEKK